MNNKAITIRQPWAWAFTNHGKGLENRSRNVKYRGPIWLHAGMTMDQDGIAALAMIIGEKSVKPARLGELPLGAIVAYAELYDVVVPEDAPSGQERWAYGPYCLLVKDVYKLPQPVPCGGQQAIPWIVPAAVLAQCEEQLKMAKKGKENPVPEPGGAHKDLGGGAPEPKGRPVLDEVTELLEQKFDLIVKLGPAIDEHKGKVKRAQKRLEDAKAELKKYEGARKDALEALPQIREGKYSPPVETEPIEFKG